MSVWDIEVGLLNDNEHAKEVAARYVSYHTELEWTGQWDTMVPGTMSTIQVRNKSWSVEVGPIWDNGHARQVAEQYVASHPDVEWTRQWSTTVVRQTSVIQVQAKRKY